MTTTTQHCSSFQEKQTVRTHFLTYLGILEDSIDLSCLHSASDGLGANKTNVSDSQKRFFEIRKGHLLDTSSSDPVPSRK